MRAKLKRTEDLPSDIVCCEGSRAASDRTAGLVVEITDPPVMLKASCRRCGAVHKAMHYAVDGQAFGWAYVDGLDIDEGSGACF